jgi:hypothetical protein
MKAALSVSLAALAGVSIAAYGQNNVTTATSGPVHPGTTILDAMGIVAGAPAEAGRLVHPGTAILDSMGIFAGLPVLDAPTGNIIAVTAVTPK